MLPSPVPAGKCGFAPFSHLPPAATAVALLGQRACRWPLGDTSDAGFAFCGAAQLPRGSYCASHARMALAGAHRRGRAA